MRILVMGLNYRPEPIGIAVYTADLCEGLAARGHQVSVVCAHPYYPLWQREAGGKSWSRRAESGVDVHRCPIYVPRVPNTSGRLLHYLSFACSALVPLLKSAFQRRPAVVIAIAPSLVAAPLARLAAGITGARSWLHVQDFEVEAAFATELVAADSLIAKIARWFERRTIRSFGTVSSISPEMCAKLSRMKSAEQRVYELRNWADVAIRPLTGPSPYRALWKIDRPFVALYSGNIAQKQGIDIILDAARQLSHRQDLLFVICGEGPNRAAIEQRAQGLDNIQFHDLQPIDRLPDLLALAAVHLLPQRRDAADLVLPSKLTNMLASGIPVVVTADPGTGLAREIEGCGIAVPPEQPQLFAAAIERLLHDRALRAGSAATALRRAAQVWNREAILDKLTLEIGHA